MLSFLFATVIEAILVWFGYSAWFRPEDYIRRVNAARSQASEIFPFVMRIWTVRHLTRNSQVDLWWARIILFIMTLIVGVVWLASFAEVLRYVF